jgi:hypothetical protein
MRSQSIESRVEKLEARVTMFEELPARIDGLASQIVQLRTEIGDEFSAVREEMRAGDEETRRVLRADIQDLGTQMRVLHEDVMSKLALLAEARAGRPSSRARERSGK